MSLDLITVGAGATPEAVVIVEVIIDLAMVHHILPMILTEPAMANTIPTVVVEQEVGSEERWYVIYAAKNIQYSVVPKWRTRVLSN